MVIHSSESEKLKKKTNHIALALFIQFDVSKIKVFIIENNNNLKEADKTNKFWFE